MALDILPLRDDLSNADIYNYVRNGASTDYQRRIPAATKADVQAQLANIANNTPLRNEFINALVNRIGLVIARNANWTNPLAKFKRGMLEYGDTIEEIQSGLTKAYVYDPDRDAMEQAIFGQERPEVQSSFHKVNRENYYKITINEAMLKRAFLDPGGLSAFVAQLMTAPSTSDNWDEFLLTASLFKEYEANNGFFKVNVPNISAPGSTANDAKQMLRRTREFADNLTFISRHYNAAHMPVVANRNDLELFVTPQANSAIDVEALSAAFNIDKANIPSRTTVIPQEHFGIPNVQAILTTKDFFVIADHRFETTSAPNPVGLYTNYFLHHHQVISASKYVPAIMFTTEPGDVITIADTPVTDVSPLVVTDGTGDIVAGVIRGKLYTVAGEALTTPEGGWNDAVRFSLDGALSPRTYLTQTGTLHIGPDEASNSITVTATSTEDDTFTEVKVLPVTGELVNFSWPDAE